LNRVLQPTHRRQLFEIEVFGKGRKTGQFGTRNDRPVLASLFSARRPSQPTLLQAAPTLLTMVGTAARSFRAQPQNIIHYY
jgi:hypothetical protein